MLSRISLLLKSRLLSCLCLVILGVAIQPVRAADSAAVPASPSGIELPPRLLLQPFEKNESPFVRFEGRLSPLEERLFSDAVDGRWNDHTLLSASLVASGVGQRDKLDHYLARFGALAEELRRTVSATTPQLKAQQAFEFLHRRVLRHGYLLEATDLVRALDEGVFNCVSASVLFNWLAGELGLEARGLETTGHAMSRLQLPGGNLDIETTCPDWFALLGDPKRQSERIATTPGARPAANRSQAMREVSDVQLVATIYYNRGVDLLGRKRFCEALAANAKALRLDPSSATARGNLLATLNNWAIALGASGHFAEAAALLEKGIAVDPQYATFHANYRHVHRQWIDDLCKAERFAEARDRLDKAAQVRPRESEFVSLRQEMYRRWVRTQFAAGKLDAGFTVLEEAGRDLQDSRSWNDIEVAEINRYAVRLLDEGRASEAVKVLDRGLGRRPESKVLRDNRLAAVMRWAEPAFREKDFAEAIRRTVHNASPGELHPLLLKNLRYGYHEWISTLVAKGKRTEAERIAKQAADDPFLAGQTAGTIPPSLSETSP